MERLKSILLAGIFFCFCQPVLAQYRINFDYQTTLQVSTNAAQQIAVEEMQIQQVEKQKTRQEKMAEMAATIAAYKELAMLTLENAKGFGTETGIYKGILNKCLSIISHANKALKVIMNTNITGKAIAAVKVHEIVAAAASLANTFHIIVTDATVPNPLKFKEYATSKEDLNLLNPAERIGMASRINIELRKLDSKLVALIYYCEHNSIGELVRQLDPETYRNFNIGKMYSSQIVRTWNQIAGN